MMISMCESANFNYVAENSRFVFACSHGGDVACINADTGRQIWNTDLPGHLDAGLTVSQDLKV